MEYKVSVHVSPWLWLFVWDGFLQPRVTALQSPWKFFNIFFTLKVLKSSRKWVWCLKVLLVGSRGWMTKYMWSPICYVICLVIGGSNICVANISIVLIFQGHEGGWKFLTFVINEKDHPRCYISYTVKAADETPLNTTEFWYCSNHLAADVFRCCRLFLMFLSFHLQWSFSSNCCCVHRHIYALM